MKQNKPVLMLLLFFVASILVRSPHLDRPLSKHHEFNPAVVLLGLESWKQGGGAENFHFVPLMNYQNSADKLLHKGAYIDSAGNLTYLSFGPGWYVIPYLTFNTFNIPFTPLALQVLNLFFLAISLSVLYRFIYYLFLKMGREPFLPSLGACFVFVFNPSLLWFMGNGYITTGIVLPFLILIIHYGTRMLYEPGCIDTKRLVVFALAGMCSIYIDWYGVSFLAIICMMALFKVRLNKKYWILFGISSFTIVISIAIILFQFASHSGWPSVFEYWTSRYHERGVVSPGMNQGSYLLKISKHLVTGFLPVLILLMAAFVMTRKNFRQQVIAQPIRMAMISSLAACLLNTVIFLNWTGVHDFAVIPYSIFLSLLSAWLIHLVANPKYIGWMAGSLVILTLIQYYYINFPGRHTANGFPYNSYQETGNFIRRITAPDERIFCNDNYMIYQYYAKRNFTHVSSYEEAVKWARTHQVPKSVWIKIRETPAKVTIDEVRHFK